MNTRVFAAAGLAIVTAAGLAGCANSGGGGGASGDGNVTVTYTNFISNGGNEKNLDKIVAAFEKANKGIKVKVTTLPYDDYGTALQTDLAAGTVSDVFDIEYANYASYQANGVLAPLEVSDPSVYSDSLLTAYQTDGTQYALPSSFSDVVLYYNADLFDAAGVEHPSADWKWADEKAAAQKLTDQAKGQWGDHQPVSFYEYYKVLAQNGGSFLNKDGTKVAFNTPEGIEAAHWLVDKSGTVMPTIEQGQGTADFDTNLFKDGKLAMLHSGIWIFSALADVPFKWDIAVEPGNTDQASAVFSNAVGVSAGSKHVAEATKWAEFLTASDTTVNTRLDAGWELPPIADQDKLSTYLDKGAPANRQAVFDSLKGIALPPVVANGQSEMQDIMTEELVEAQAGRKTVEDALSSAEQRINAAIAG
ncbi:ABC transporter substrate-binding protein [Naasia aerilata]|uniref:Sugar ABC transporter substrate-binding protein n=1 Tax=Naasia aerilata TaxID=1162966 RepID=A0ABM8GDZ8_9MICO|nr:sugar ABC transporter substrate-binding protein [Naasia aerilata]BDZ46518.1 sugar ABC transporter substrate-binding protein [Naasia aerilata]